MLRPIYSLLESDEFVKTLSSLLIGVSKLTVIRAHRLRCKGLTREASEFVCNAQLSNALGNLATTVYNGSTTLPTLINPA